MDYSNITAILVAILVVLVIIVATYNIVTYLHGVVGRVNS